MCLYSLKARMDSLVYLCAGGGLVGAIVIFILAKVLQSIPMLSMLQDVTQARLLERSRLPLCLREWFMVYVGRNIVVLESIGA